SFLDTNGDGIGDLPGVIERLPYIASLNVDAVWLSPFFKSPQADMGYDVSDYRAVDPMFGTLEDFDRLVVEAHRLGLKVIIDQVLAHTSDRHPWFVESRASRDNDKADWYVWSDALPDGSAPNNWLSVFGGPAWEWDATRRQYYMHNFLAAQPQLNFHNEAVQQALLDGVRFWLERGVDGFRLDTVNYYVHDRWLRSNPPLAEAVAGTITESNTYLYQSHLFDKSQPENPDFLKRFRALCDEFGVVGSVGEVGDETRSLDTVAAYTSGGDKLNMCYTFDMLGEAFSPEHIRASIENFFAKAPEGWVCWAFSNHDVVRHVTRWTRDSDDPQDVAKFAISLLACLRGSICLYQGEELGLGESELTYEQLRDPVGIRFWPGNKGRDGCRTPLPWDSAHSNAGFSSGAPWLPVAATDHAVAQEDGDADSVLNRYRAVLGARRAAPELVAGDIDFLEATGAILAFVRSHEGQKILCVFNFGANESRYSLPAGFRPRDETILPAVGAYLNAGVVTLASLSSFVARCD
ncbi:alpha-glucosidase, partial [Escherichia coli]|nr:alpha-glucosidase [Escherichia coli]